MLAPGGGAVASQRVQGRVPSFGSKYLSTKPSGLSYMLSPPWHGSPIWNSA